MTQGSYCARHAQQQREQRLITCHPKLKLMLGTECFDLIIHMLRRHLPPEQISGKLKAMKLPNLRDAYARPSILPLTHYWLATCVKS